MPASAETPASEVPFTAGLPRGVHWASFTFIVIVFLALCAAACWIFFHAYADTVQAVREDGEHRVSALALTMDGGALGSLASYASADSQEALAVLRDLRDDGFDGMAFWLRRQGDSWAVLSDDEAEFNKPYDASRFAPVILHGEAYADGPRREWGHHWMLFAAPVADAAGEIRGALILHQRIDATLAPWRDRAILLLFTMIFSLLFLIVSLAQIRRYTRRVLLREMRKANHLGVVEREKRELFDVARRVHRSIVPRELPPFSGTNLALKTFFFQEVEGDFFDGIPLDDRSAALFLCESKGNESSITLANLLLDREIRAGARVRQSPADILRQANQQVSQVMGAEFLASALYLEWQAQTRTIRYAGAGHPPPIWLPADGSAPRSLDVDPKLLGSRGNTDVQQREVVLQPGDRLILFSDGVLKAARQESKDVVPFGVARFQEAVLTHRAEAAEAMADALLTAAVAWAGGYQFLTDDITIVIFDVKSA